MHLGKIIGDICIYPYVNMSVFCTPYDFTEVKESVHEVMIYFRM